MILEYRIDFRSQTDIYARLFLNLIDKHSIDGKITKEGNILRCYARISDTDDFDNFAKEFSRKIPNSIFLYNTQVQVIKTMPQESDIVNKDRHYLPFCINCMEEVLDINNKNYYNIFTQCYMCGYGLVEQEKSYKDKILEMTKIIEKGNKIKLNTFYGTFIVGKIDEGCNKFDFDIIAYDCATISKYTNIKDYEIKAMASIEKPLIRVNLNLKFKTDIVDIQNELIRFKLADDFVLYLLMVELYKKDIDMIFITKENIQYERYFDLVTPIIIEPLEAVVSKSHTIAINGGNQRGLETAPILANKNHSLNAMYSVINEHNLLQKYTNLCSVYLSKENENSILLYGEKFGTKTYLSFEFDFQSIDEIFDTISATNETGMKLITNYISKFPQLYEECKRFDFDKISNIYELWGVLSIILGFDSINNIQQASKTLENNALLFLGERGPRIDYKLIQKDNQTLMDPLTVIRSAISFRLADIDDLTLSYGVIESFTEFISNELDSIRENLGAEAIILNGSLLRNRMLFDKLLQNISSTQKVYLNNRFLIYN